MNANATASARASVLENIHRMEQELTEKEARVIELERALQIEKDRNVLLKQHADDYKAQAHLYRGKMIELATAVSNIGLLTNEAQGIMLTVRELESKETPEQRKEEVASAADMAKRLAPEGVAAPANAAEAAARMIDEITGAGAPQT